MSEYSIGEEEDEEQTNLIGEYTGERNDHNERHGYGVAVLANGDIYRGHYENGKRNGRGHYRFKKSACRYTGLWHEGMKHGKGTFVYPDGSKYSGEWEHDMRTGHGMYVYINGNKYVGEWLEDRRQGTGACYYQAEQCKYVGQWQDDRRHGLGTLVHQDHSYHGHWRNDLPVGDGHYIFSNGMVQQGFYELVEGSADVEERHTGSSADMMVAPVPIWRPTRLICGEEARLKRIQLETGVPPTCSHISVGSVDTPPQPPLQNDENDGDQVEEDGEHDEQDSEQEQDDEGDTADNEQ